MYVEAKKLHLIAAILKVESDDVLQEVAALLAVHKGQAVCKKSFRDFAGTMSDKEADEFEKIIEDGCENIYR